MKMDMRSLQAIGGPVTNKNVLAVVEALGWPEDLPSSTYELIRRAAEQHHDDPALTFFLEAHSYKRTTRWSYGELLENVTRTANMLHQLGIRAGDVVALVLPNLPETHFALWGAEAAGVALQINPLLEPAAIASLLETCEAKVVITLAPFPGSAVHDKVVAALDLMPQQQIRDLITVDIAGYVKGWKHIPARLLQYRAKLAAQTPSAPIRVHDFASGIGAVPGDRLISGRTIRAQDIASLFCTGGTTGAPKIAQHTHVNEVSNVWMAARLMQGVFQPGDVVFAGLPLFHVHAAFMNGLASFLMGNHILLGCPEGFRAPGIVDRFWEIVAHHRVAWFSAVPTLLAALRQRPTEGHDISCLRLAFCGAAPASAALINDFQRETGMLILEGYGLTEATCTASVHPFTTEQRLGSVGLPLPFQKILIAIVDAEGNFVREAALGETGTVCLAGPNIFPGYLSAEHNERLWVDSGDGKRWLNTGDLGYLDHEGYLWLKGRSKDIIIRGGHNIDPAMIEEAFHGHPEIALVAAIGRADAYAGEVPVVYVQLREGAQVDPEALHALATSAIPERAAHPKAIYVVDKMPLTAVGKIFKPGLREMDRQRAA